MEASRIPITEPAATELVLSKETEKKPSRLISLDAFRGLVIIGMLLVNNAALDTATPKHLTHAGWNQGITFADLVFPWFLFIVGVALPYSYASHLKKGHSRGRFILKALGRAVTLVLLGCLIDSSIAKTPVIGLDVLQLIGLAFFLGAVLYELPKPFRIGAAGVFLIGYWAVLRFVPVPGGQTGVARADWNLIGYLNSMYLQKLHLAGVISVAPTAGMVLIGSCVGDILRSDSRKAIGRIWKLLVTGVALSAIGLLWSLDMPFNKPLWTSSYIVFTAGLGTLVFGFFYLVIDVVGWRRWSFPLVVFGMNAIAAYVVPILVKLYILRVWTIGAHKAPLQQEILNYFISSAGRTNGGWIYTLTYIVFWWLVMLEMYRRKIFLRV